MTPAQVRVANALLDAREVAQHMNQEACDAFGKSDLLRIEVRIGASEEPWVLNLTGLTSTGWLIALRPLCSKELTQMGITPPLPGDER